MTRTHRWLLAAVIVSLPAHGCAQTSDATRGSLAEQARRARHDGRYEAAVSLAQRALRADSADGAAARTLLRTLLDVGRYGDAEAAANALGASGSGPQSARLAVVLGDALRAQGKLDAAQSAYQRARHGADSVTARLRLATLAYERGEHDQAMREFESFIDLYSARRGTLSAAELRAVATACRYLGRTDPQLFKDALRAYDEAVGADSLDLESQVELGDLFLEKYNASDARATFDRVLRINPTHPRALLGMARVHYFDGTGDAAEFVKRSLTINAGDPETRAFSATLLMDVERYSDAANEAVRGLAADSSAPAPLVALAAARYLSGDTANFQRALDRAHARLAGSADAEVALADIAARNRLYREAAAFAERGVARDPRAARALALLGINQLRIGRISDGRANIDRAFALDPYDVWAKNTLDLLDTFKDYTEVATPRFVIAVEKKDAALLGLYMGALAEQAYDSLALRYGYRPVTPVRVEVFRSHADFSVRTVGLAGLGALGVSFGNVVAMDSPAARRVGEFNWGSTLWHELTHTFSLGMSGNKVPRWFSEGLSVYEERRARPSWGSDVSPQFIAAYKAGMLAPPSRMNDGFMRPRFPDEVILSYYQASLVCEMLEAEKGIDGIRAMLRDYGRGLTTEEVVQDVFGIDLKTLDTRFDAFVRRRLGRELQAVEPIKAGTGAEGLNWGGPFADAMRDATALAERQQWDGAVTALEKAKALFPSYAGEASPYRTLARIHRTRGDTARAILELREMTLRNETAYEPNVELADLLEARHDSVAAQQALDRALYISPFDPRLHVRLAALAAAAGDHATVIRERRAALALDPADRVEAMYQLAKAYADAGDTPSARREVLRALDLAPNFEKAQSLLLKLRASVPPGRQP